MEMQKGTADSESKQSLPEPPTSTSCRRKKSPDASFVTNLRDHFHDFINTPMPHHKTCFKTTIHNTYTKMMAIFPARNSSPKEGESPMPSQASAEN